MRIYQVTRPPERAEDSFVLLEDVVMTGISKLWPAAYFCHMRPAACFCMVHELRMIFKFLRVCKKKKIKEEHASKTICDPQSLKIYYMAHYGKSLLTTGLEHPF